MVKSYLRYEPQSSFAVIASSAGNTCYNIDAKLAIAPALEDVVLWDVKKGELVARWHDSENKAEVTCITKSPNNMDYAVGYTDGSIRIWSAETHTSTVTFNGHRGAVTALAFDVLGARLASGSKDTDIIVWDVVGETGIYRLRGHRDQITALSFIARPLPASTSLESVSSPGYILSCSKDTLLKLWDLTTQHCVETHVAHRSECWAMDVSKDGTYFVTGGGDTEMKVWKLNRDLLSKGVLEEVHDEKTEEQNTPATTPNGIARAITLHGPVSRVSRERVITIRIHPSGQYLGCQAADKSVELYRIRTEEEVRKKMQRRKKRQREKTKEKSAKQGGEHVEIADEMQDDIEVTANDEITPHQIIRTQARVRSFDFAPVEDLARAGAIQVLTSLTNNILEVHSSPLPPKSKSETLPDPEKLYSVDLPGHRGDIRALALSGDDELLCSASNNTLRIWNVNTGHCIRSLNCGYALTAAFLPGNRHVILGTKSGDLELYDIQSASLVEMLETAHEGAIWSLQVRPDKRGLVTGGADKDVKFWDFDMVEENKAGVKQRRLTLLHTRTLKMADDVLCVRYSPDQKFIAVALLDATVKVFFHDTLKFYLSLYGHKLPVLSMDVSSDNALLVTASADKNVKLWGLDFGDCHKSLFAHQESVMSVAFVWGTHYFFSVSKDKYVKHWDGDKFECIQKFPGHHGEVWALAVGKHGMIVATGSHDRSIRIWKKTEEMLFLEEEKEKELEELHEKEATKQADALELANTNGEAELAAAGKQTAETLKAGEKVAEALEIGDADLAAWREYEKAKTRNKNMPAPQRSPFLLAMGDITPEEYVLKTLEKVRSSELEEALLVLPFDKIISLLEYMNSWAKKEWNLPLTCRILFFLLKVHQHQIIANRIMRPTLTALRGHLRDGLRRQKDVLGYNLAALRFIRRDIEDNNADFFDQDVETSEAKKESETVKRKFLSLA